MIPVLDADAAPDAADRDGRDRVGDENALTALPPCLTDFPLLTRLTVNGNKLTMLPKMPPQLEELLAASERLRAHGSGARRDSS